MTIAAIIALLTTLIKSTTGLSVLALLASWVAGKGLVLLLQQPAARRIFAYGLKSAGAPAVILGKWLQAGPLALFSGPIICLLIFVGFWFFTFMDRLLTYMKPDTQAMAEALEKMLSESGSTDRRLYIQSKGMTEAQVTAVSQMAAAVAAKPAELSEDQRAVLMRAQVVGLNLQNDRLNAEP